jgi:hypothetical protein
MTYTVTLTATNINGSDIETATLTELNAEILSSSAISTTVSKGINDLMWLCQLEYEGHPAIDNLDISVIMKDHTDTDQLVFMGYIPAPTYKTQEGGHKTTVTAYSYFWFLTKQYLPSLESDDTGAQNTMFFVSDDGTETTPAIDIYNLQAGCTTVQPGETVYINIKKYVEYLLGGIASTTINGLTIHEVTDNDDWNDGTLKNKAFDFIRDDITIMDALQIIRDYTGYYFIEVFYNSTTDLDYAVWVPGTATDADLHIPSKVTFTWPSEYVIGPVYGEDKSGEKYNKIRVRCSPVGLLDKATATSATDSVVLTVPGLADSCFGTVQHGLGGEIEDSTDTWSASTVYNPGKFVIYTNSKRYKCIQTTTAGRVCTNTSYWTEYPLFTTTEHLSGGAVDWVTFTGMDTSDIMMVEYLPDVDYYEQTWETAGVTAGTDKPIMYPPVWDRTGELGLTTQDDVDEYCNLIQGLIETDSSIYHATLKLRTDLRLMQLVKFVGYDKIPEQDMRITYITYRKNPEGIFVDIQCTLDRTLTIKKQMKEIMMVSDVNLIERIVDKKLKDTNNELTTAAWIKWAGNGTAIAQTDNGVYITKPTI